MLIKERSAVKNWKEAFWETASCSVNTCHRITAFPSRGRLLRPFLWNLQRDIWKPIEASGENENILRWKLEIRFLRNCFVMCEFISQSYTTLFMEQFGSTVFGDSQKGYFELHWSLGWQRYYPQIKTRKKLSEKVFCDMRIHLPELHISFPGAVC